MSTMDQALQASAARWPDHPAMVDLRRGLTLTYAELDRRVGQAAAALVAAGVGPGDTVGLHLGTGVEYVVLTYALWRALACVVPVATELAADEKADLARTIALRWLVGPAPRPGAAAEAGASFLPGTPGVAVPLPTEVATVLTAVNSQVAHPPGFAQLGAAFIRFTSGTTGECKGVVLSHRTIDERIGAANAALAIGPQDRVLWLLSMSYHFTVSIVAYLTFGATIILPRNTLAAAAEEAAREQRATLLYGSPLHCALLADYPAGQPLPHLRLALSTTAALPPEISARFDRRYGLPVSQALGLIELGLPCMNLLHARDRPASIGQVLPGYRLRLDDLPGTDGWKEIYFAGPGALDAYYRPFRTRDQIMPGGWFATHDVGELDADGCLHLRGRTKDIISVAGMKFFPQEVERVLEQHPAVQEAQVYPAPDARTGQVPRARVVLHTEGPAPRAADGLEQQLVEHCRQHLASYKVPASIETVDRLPRTASGKVLHRNA